MMKLMNLGLALSIAACFACGAQPVDLQASTTPGPAGPPPAIDPRVDEILTAASMRLSTLAAFRLRCADTQDVVQDNGQKLQYAALREVVIRRPDRAWAQTTGDLVNRMLWKDGESVTLFDPEQMIYGRIDDPGSIEQMMDELLDVYGFSTPMADLLSEDLHAVFTEGVTSADYLGEHLVGEERCHHLAFDHPDIDYQLWYSTGDSPQLRKLVITDTDAPGSPQYTLTILELEPLEAADVPDSLFVAQIPEEAEEIEIVPIESPEEGR
jgi:hypothetical protein